MSSTRPFFTRLISRSSTPRSGGLRSSSAELMASSVAWMRSSGRPVWCRKAAARARFRRYGSGSRAPPSFLPLVQQFAQPRTARADPARIRTGHGRPNEARGSSVSPLRCCWPADASHAARQRQTRTSAESGQPSWLEKDGAHPLRVCAQCQRFPLALGRYKILYRQRVAPDEKELRWVGTAFEDLLAFPLEVRRQAGFQLGKVQAGEEPDDWKPFDEIGSGTRELRLRDRQGAYRVMYVAKFDEAVYVLHCFQKSRRPPSCKTSVLPR